MSFCTKTPLISPSSPRRPLLLAHGDGGVLSALSVARRSGAQQGVAWFCGSLALWRRGVPVRGPRDDRLGKAGGEASFITGTELVIDGGFIAR